MEEGNISNVQAGLMIGVAILFDLIQAGTKTFHFIPGIGNLFALFSGWFISICGWIIFTLWFMLNGISPFRAKKLIVYASGGIIEMIPLLNALPGWTISVAGTIGITKFNTIKKKSYFQKS